MTIRLPLDPQTGRRGQLPPTDSLDPELAKALKAYETARAQQRDDSQALEQLTRQRRDAQARDRQEQAAALARGKDIDFVKNADELEAKIQRAERRLETRRLLTKQALEAAQKVLDLRETEISHATAARLVETRQRWTDALDALEKLAAELNRVHSIDTWTRSGGNRYRATSATVPDRGGHQMNASEVIAQLRDLCRPRALPVLQVEPNVTRRGPAKLEPAA